LVYFLWTWCTTVFWFPGRFDFDFVALFIEIALFCRTRRASHLRSREVATVRQMAHRRVVDIKYTSFHRHSLNQYASTYYLMNLPRYIIYVIKEITILHVTVTAICRPIVPSVKSQSLSRCLANKRRISIFQQFPTSCSGSESSSNSGNSITCFCALRNITRRKLNIAFGQRVKFACLQFACF